MAVFILAAAIAVGAAPAWADPEGGYGHGKGEGRGEYGHGKSEGHGGYGQHGMGGGWHGSTGHLLRHLLKHEKEIGLKDDQVAKLKELQLNLDRTRIKTEADAMIAERELRAMVEDDKSDLSAIQSKLKQTADLEVSLRLEAIKTRKEALALLTPEQREKEKMEHEKMMQEHKVPKGEMHGGGMQGGGMPHGPMH
jgi:Spy/CpxP family protein refolding chaperone